MRTLVYLEPLWFRGSSTFLRGHIDSFVLPILNAIYCDEKPAKICFVSNIILCMDFLNALRRSEIEVEDISLFSITSTQAIVDCNFRSDVYSADLMQDTYEDLQLFGLKKGNKTLLDRISTAFNNFCPNLVISTAQNRYVRKICDDASIPLISCEFGPLPRIPYPKVRFLSLDGHLSDGPFGSVIALRKALSKPDSIDVKNTHIETFKSHYISSISQHTFYYECQKVIQREVKTGTSVAMLTLQPDDWLTWEGVLQISQGPAQIVLRALQEMSSNKLIVTFHSDLRGRVVGDQFAEIWLSNPSLIRLPDALAVNTSELFIPFVDEVITVSSNTAMSAFLFGKRITALGKSFANTLKELVDNKSASNCSSNAVVEFLLNEYCISDELFTSPVALHSIISSKIQKKFGDISQLGVPSFGVVRSSVRPHDTLSEIHQKIEAYRQTGGDNAELIKIFGRHAIGYLINNGGIGAELGVATGTFSESLLMSGNFKTLYSIDAWSDHHDEDEFISVCERLSKYKDASVILRGNFSDIIVQIPNNYLDFIYVDAYAHTGVAAEIIQDWLPKCKSDAIIAGHDFCHINWPSNHDKLVEVFQKLSLSDVIKVPGIFTFNSEDIFPSFVVNRKAPPTFAGTYTARSPSE